MTEFASNNPWLLLGIGVLAGMLLGGLLVALLERKKSGGRSVEELQQELDDYKEEVGKHFATTSELFRDMTEKYRDVYNHLATGSQELCEDAMDHARLEFTQAKKIEDDGVTEQPAEPEEPSNASPEADKASQKAPEKADNAESEEASESGSDDHADKRDDPPLGV